MLKFGKNFVIVKFISLILMFLFASSTLANTQRSQERTFEGYQIKFDYEKYPEEREIGYQYYLDEESKYLPGIEKKDIGIDLYDIDGDGKQEIFMYVNGGDRCPRSGCRFAILKKNSEGFYVEIPWSYKKGSNLGIHNPPRILNSITSGYNDILFGQEGDRISIYVWKDGYYDTSKIIDY